MYSLLPSAGTPTARRTRRRVGQPASRADPAPQPFPAPPSGRKCPSPLLTDKAAEASCPRPAPPLLLLLRRGAGPAVAALAWAAAAAAPAAAAAAAPASSTACSSPGAPPAPPARPAPPRAAGASLSLANHSGACHAAPPTSALLGLAVRGTPGPTCPPTYASCAACARASAAPGGLRSGEVREHDRASGNRLERRQLGVHARAPRRRPRRRARRVGAPTRHHPSGCTAEHHLRRCSAAAVRPAVAGRPCVAS